jgi:hypothetical protein
VGWALGLAGPVLVKWWAGWPVLGGLGAVRVAGHNLKLVHWQMLSGWREQVLLVIFVIIDFFNGY